MKRINELKDKLDEIEDIMPPNDLIYALKNTVNYLDEMKDIKLSGDAKVETRKLVYQLHDRLVINNES